MDNPVDRIRGISAAATAVGRGDLVVLPTDTVYGIGCDAFSPKSVTALLAAKGRGRDMPVPVLVGHPNVVDGLAYDLSSVARDLIDGFWPGALTVVVKAQPSLAWDLGDVDGTVAVRMPLHPVAIEVLRMTGPMAVSSANRSGSTPATTAEEALEQLGEDVAIYLESGPCGEPIPSTIVDLTGAVPRVARLGAIDLDTLRTVCPEIVSD
jgi:tRNA threonylcarbamoyl adenosine modification protein (Sua5/YciO/YrdC/YwlC family)